MRDFRRSGAGDGLHSRKNRRPNAQSWAQRRKAAGDRKPLSCPRCGHPMALWCLLFGQPLAIAQLLGIDLQERVAPNLFLDPPGAGGDGVMEMKNNP
jgi:hypothetical protein